MPDWRRIVIGDAFKTADRNYYRDLFLLWPFFLFSLVAVINFSPAQPHSERLYTYKLAACALAALMLAKEKAFLLLGSLGFVALRLGVALLLGRWWSWRHLLAFAILASLAAVLTMVLNARGWKPSYTVPDGMHVWELLSGVGGLLFGLVVTMALRPN